MVQSLILPAYAELQCFSNFTFLHGASHAEELVARAKALGYAALAITDECSLAGVVRAHEEAKEAKLPLLIGSYFRVTENDGSTGALLTVLAQNREGYGNLCEFITMARTRADKGVYRVGPDDFEQPEAPYSHLRRLPDCLAMLSTPAGGIDVDDRFDAQVRWASRVFFDRLWIGLSLHGGPDDEILRERARRA